MVSICQSIRVDQNRMASNWHGSVLKKNSIRRLARVLDLDLWWSEHFLILVISCGSRSSQTSVMSRCQMMSDQTLGDPVTPVTPVRWIPQCVRCAWNPSGSKTRGLCTQKVLGLREEQLHSVGLSFPLADIAWNGKGLGKWKRVEHSRMIQSLAHRLNAGPMWSCSPKGWGPKVKSRTQTSLIEAFCDHQKSLNPLLIWHLDKLSKFEHNSCSKYRNLFCLLSQDLPSHWHQRVPS